MPKLPIEAMVAGLSDSEEKIVRSCFNGRNGCLRASKPHGRIDFNNLTEKTFSAACSNYVWRMLCFDFVSYTPHSCIPITADFDVSSWLYRKYGREGSHELSRQVTKILDLLVKRIESVMPVTAQAGAMRWARAYGMI
jgi:hypothetical protein